MGAVKSVVFGSLETISASKAQQQTGFVEGNWSSQAGRTSGGVCKSANESAMKREGMIWEEIIIGRILVADDRPQKPAAPEF